MTTYKTKYGDIFYDNTGNDHRSNIRDYHPKFPAFHEAVKLQAPALAAFQEAEKRYGRKTHPKHKIQRARAIPVTGSWRSFDLQASLYNQDSSRYASPYSSGHVQGIAIDVNNDLSDFDEVQRILLNVGWVQARSDERWHFTWGVKV